MNPRINQLVKSLLQKESLDQCSLQELRQFADRHPYFGAAQLLLTKKLQAENSGEYERQLQKTFTFFHNPLWVEHLLNDTGRATVIAAPVTEPEIQQPSADGIKSAVVETSPVQAQVQEMTEEKPASVPVIQEQPVVADTMEMLTPAPAAAAKEEMLFEPFHTVDYFASQGIRLQPDEKPKDALGQRLMSFTEWLKTLKKLPASDLEKLAAPAAEKKVEELAEHSLQEGEVITEAMAEVWEKQGNREKAIGIYDKLSLLEPAKSRYFAAKIEELKKTI